MNNTDTVISDQPDNLQLRCKTCDTPVHSRKTIPPSPAPHLLRTIQAPNATEAIHLREALRLANPIVHQLDDDIPHVQMLLDELRRKRELLLKFIAEQNAIVAPIRRLPAEILAEIFVLCMNYDISSFDPMQSPLLVGRVCRGWRQVALSTQKLWSSITVTDYRSSSKMVKLWMSRAISAPLTIHLNSAHHYSSNVGEIESVIAVLVQYCDRWQHLDMNFYRTRASCLSSIRHNLPLLESLRIRSSTAFVNIFEVAPHLHTLSLDSWSSRIRLKVPWSQLTELETQVSCSTDGLYTLKLMPNLVKCTMHKSDNSGSVLPHNISVITLSHLRFFCILGIRPDNIFNHLHLPTISALRIGYQEMSGMRWYSRQPFMSLLSSRTLRKLEIEDGLDEYQDSTHIGHFLQATPALEELHLRGLNYPWVTDDLLHLLTRCANTDVLVPALETLEISSELIPCGPSTSMIESRWRIAKEDGYGGARLKRLQFQMSGSNNWLVDVENLNRLRKCRQEGMVISITVSEPKGRAHLSGIWMTHAIAQAPYMSEYPCFPVLNVTEVQQHNLEDGLLSKLVKYLHVQMIEELRGEVLRGVFEDEVFCFFSYNTVVITG
ncbi:hypothetical protein PILCRDRAFT_89650 [Piloderma croceum F 1598]|uniref:F-box domain-containing protein n=1 Tax=Piloderma croceum (strain F 1598) TaxID=765440 RepID=A0A0C3F6R9_PILCF|nr:hypothetical protein PILCRDRAFT_89650 [Piloderma croceum F 1598]